MSANGAMFGQLGGAVGSIFGAIGDFQEARGYQKAAGYAELNAKETEAMTKLQVQQAGRQIYQTIGGQVSDVAGAGLAEGGSAVDLLRSSMEQGALQKQLIETQGSINARGFEEQASAYNAQADAANMAGAGGVASGILQGIGAFI